MDSRRPGFCCSLFLVLFTLGCAPEAPSRGALLEAGVAEAAFEVRAHGSDLVRVSVVFPSDAQGLPAGRALPALVFIHGGLVAPTRYRWQAAALARAGYVVALPEHPLDLAIFSAENGLAARRLLVDSLESSLLRGVVDSARIAVGGHSLGGVVAVKLALAGGFDRLVLEASYPDAADESQLGRLRLPVLSVRAEQDCSADPAQVEAGFDKLPGPGVFAKVAGMTHYQFTDSDAEDLQRGCEPAVGLFDAHATVTELLQRFLGGALDAESFSGLPGVEVRVR